MTLTSLVFSFCPLKGVYELLPRVELGTSSLPRMRSTTELKQHFLLLRRGRSLLSERQDSNPRPPAWKASALSTELFPQERSFLTAKRLRQSPRTAKLSCGCGWIRTTEVERQQIYSLPHLATLENTLVSNYLLRKSSVFFLYCQTI